MTSPDRAKMRGALRPALLVGPAFIALAVLVFYDSRSIQADDFYSGVSARAFPDIISAGLLIVGIGLLIGGLRGSVQLKLVDAGSSVAIPLGRMALLALGLLLNVALMKPAGFVPAMFALFFCTARAFGARGWVMPAAFGIALPAAIYMLFGWVIGVQLPPALGVLF